MNRQKLVLCLLLCILAGALAYSFLRFPKQQEVPPLKNRPAPPVISKGDASSSRKGGEADDGARLRLELLEQDLPGFTGFRRNIFAPIFRDETKVTPMRLPPPPPPLPSLPPPPAPAPPPLPAPPSEDQLAAKELAKFTFLGFLSKNEEKTVFLSNNGEIFLAKKGSTLGTKYQVADITDQALTIKAVNGGRQLVIPLVENTPLGTRSNSKRSP